MPPVPAVRGSQVVGALEKAGFVVGNGSHHTMRHPDGRRTTVPVHAGRDIHPGRAQAAGADVSEIAIRANRAHSYTVDDPEGHRWYFSEPL